MKKFRILATLLPAVPFFLCASLVACFDDSGDDFIKVAVEAPLSGDQSSNGLDMLRGVQLAVAEVNAAGGVLGKRIRLVEADDRADPVLGVEVARQMAGKGVAAVIGPYNSAVGIENLPVYIASGIVPVHLTSNDATAGQGVTVQPKNSQVSPFEVAYIAALKPQRVSMLVDPSAYTQRMSERLQAGLEALGVSVTAVPISANATDYTDAVRVALSTQPQVVYSSTYFPQGALVAKALAAEASSGGGTAACFMGLANQDPAFITAAGIAVSRRCVFSGVPAPDQLPDAAQYVARYRAAYPGVTPGVWGPFTYDSAMLLFDAMEKAGYIHYEPVLKALLSTVNFAGVTGSITIDPSNGYRTNVPVRILEVSPEGAFVVID